MTRTFQFADKVRKIGSDEVFVVLGTEPSGLIQVARFNHKTAFKADVLECAA